MSEQVVISQTMSEHPVERVAVGQIILAFTVGGQYEVPNPQLIG
jgi:hypothetical protein